jgi:hypothetical protein
MGVVIAGNEAGKGTSYNDVNVYLTKNAMISDTSRGDFTIRQNESTSRIRKKEMVNVDMPDSTIFKLLQGKKIEKLECTSANCYKIDVNVFPSMQEMEDRADILAKLLILYNKSEYPIMGEIGIGGNRRRDSFGNVTGGVMHL